MARSPNGPVLGFVIKSPFCFNLYVESDFEQNNAHFVLSALFCL